MAALGCESAIADRTFDMDSPVVRDVDRDESSVSETNLDGNDALVRRQSDRTERERPLLLARVSGRKARDEKCNRKNAHPWRDAHRSNENELSHRSGSEAALQLKIY